MMMLPENIVNKIMLYVTHHPVAMMYRKNKHESYEDIKNKRCYCEGDCDCDERTLEWVSNLEFLYNIQHCHKKTDHKLETMLELKVIMNQIKNKIDICNDDESVFAYMDRQLMKLKESCPIFLHCNRKMILNCLLITLRDAKLNLNKYEELYDQFYRFY